MSKNQSKYLAKTKTVIAARETLTVKESFFATPAKIDAMTNATKYALVNARNANWAMPRDSAE